MKYKAYMVSRDADGRFFSAIVERSTEQLPAGDVLIRVDYSSLNYKDALSATGAPGVTKHYPHVPGIDAAGTVVESSSGAFTSGDPVIVTGYDLGVETDGGYGQYIRVPAEWVIPLPEGLTLRESMILGTAGFTAAQGLRLLQQNQLRPEHGEVVVTGATGGVGCMAVMLLAKAGYEVVACTGKEDAHGFLSSLGAKRIIGRGELDDRSGRPLLKAIWAGGIDTVGGNMLSTLIRSTQKEGSVAACGVVAGKDLPLTVFPFILRGVKLLGIDSALAHRERRLEIWGKLAKEWKLTQLELINQSVGLQGLDEQVQNILHGRIRGRILITLQ